MAFYPTVVSSKGLVGIPMELRKKLGLKKGTRATWSEEDRRLVLTPITDAAIGRDHGFSQAGAGGTVSVRGVF
jgi:bifunctional DNA-binding transcriptional regulator/antitoxin component of YhaV-PrlF toxin-antitoxin module